MSLEWGIKGKEKEGGLLKKRKNEGRKRRKGERKRENGK
jgi:hypothetical protein